jgi:hypothetical protein
MRRISLRWLRSACLLLLAGLPGILFTPQALAQRAEAPQVATSSAGQAGRRETREEAATRINPLAAVNGRVQNRVQSRLRTRIDRFYAPDANTLSPFVVAAERARNPAASRRR